MFDCHPLKIYMESLLTPLCMWRIVLQVSDDVPEHDKRKQDRLRRRRDSEDKVVTVAKFVNAQHTRHPHFPLSEVSHSKSSQASSICGFDFGSNTHKSNCFQAISLLFNSCALPLLTQ